MQKPIVTRTKVNGSTITVKATFKEGATKSSKDLIRELIIRHVCDVGLDSFALQSEYVTNLTKEVPHEAGNA